MSDRVTGRLAVTIPPGLLGVMTLLWGNEQFVLAYALPMAVVVELARFAPFAWDFGDRDFHRLADVSSVGLLLLVVAQFSDHGLSGIYGVLRWFPVVLLGLLLGQCYSTREAIKLSALFLSVRLALSRGRITDPGTLDMRLPYLVACLLSASAGPERNLWVIPIAAMGLIWLLLANRPRTRSITAVVLSLGACLMTAQFAQQGATLTRRAIEPYVMEIVRERLRYWRDPYRQQTAIGDIGELKLSNRIVLRVQTPPGTEVPRLLREASYNYYNNNVWFSRERKFEDLESKAVGTRWDLGEARQPYRLTTISRSLYRNRGMLALPNGSFRLDDLPVEELKRNRTGAVKVVNGPDLIRYQVRYNERYSTDTPPVADDLQVPDSIRGDLLSWLQGRKLDNTPTADLLRALQDTFNSDFRYSLRLPGRHLFKNPVIDFLNSSRKGHCEFFATATVLLLRAVGIPARYASGFLVQEYSPLERRYLVRRRHAHSWTQVWWQGHWQDFDTTPAIWFGQEEAQAPWWQSSYDVVSMLVHAWSLWRLSGDEGEESNLMIWLLPPLILFLLWRAANSRRVRRQNRVRSRLSPENALPVPDTDYRLIEQSLARRGMRRPPGLPGGIWLRRLLADRHQSEHGLDIIYRQILPLYNRHRFHPKGLSPGQRQDMERQIRDWLGKFDTLRS